MAILRYRLSGPVTVVLRENDRHRLAELPAGSVLVAADSKPHQHRMINATCNGETILIFARDLDERAEPLEPVRNAAPVRALPNVAQR